MLVTLTWFQCLRRFDPVIEPTFQPVQDPYSATVMTPSTGVASVMSRTVNICQETSTLMIRWWDLKNRRGGGGEAPKMTMIVSFFLSSSSHVQLLRDFDSLWRKRTVDSLSVCSRKTKGEGEYSKTRKRSLLGVAARPANRKKVPKMMIRFSWSEEGALLRPNATLMLPRGDRAR